MIFFYPSLPSLRQWRTRNNVKRMSEILATNMKFYMVVNYYLVNFNYKFHEDQCMDACTKVVNARAHVLLRVRAFRTRARAFESGSS